MRKGEVHMRFPFQYLTLIFFYNPVGRSMKNV